MKFQTCKTCAPQTRTGNPHYDMRRASSAGEVSDTARLRLWQPSCAPLLSLQCLVFEHRSLAKTTLCSVAIHIAMSHNVTVRAKDFNESMRTTIFHFARNVASSACVEENVDSALPYRNSYFLISCIIGVTAGQHINELCRVSTTNVAITGNRLIHVPYFESQMSNRVSRKLVL